MSASLIALGLFMFVNLLAASSGAAFPPGDWYESLDKPSWTPPNWAFPVVWTMIFIMVAVSGWLVWEAAGWGAAGALGLYGANLALNAGWSAIFFGLKRMDLALAEVAFLWLSIAALIWAFSVYSTLAALLLLPYLLWVTVAAALNLRMVQLNPRAI
ncbi:MAG: TspO/MBR family protein [Pseudomonadota bacterium]